MKFFITVRPVAQNPGNCGVLIGKKISGLNCFQNRSYICLRNGKLILLLLKLTD